MLTEAKWATRLGLLFMALTAGFCGWIAWRTDEIARHQRNIDSRDKALDAAVWSDSAKE